MSNKKNFQDFENCKRQVIKGKQSCYHPCCSSKSINSHILQKNGILSSIAVDRHLWGIEVNTFRNPPFHFRRIGINDAYSFKCFCNSHDTELFSKIEQKVIDFEDYESCLLFTLRAIYNEIFRKEVNIETYKCLLSSGSKDLNVAILLELIKSEELGLNDLQSTVDVIWNDLNNGDESFVFESSDLQPIDLCLSAFFNYDTTIEFDMHRRIHGKDMEEVSPIFINIFPYNGKTKLMMGYMKKDESKVKGYFYQFFKQSEKKVQRLLTNLMLFRCETWVISENLYNKFAKGNEAFLYEAINIGMGEYNERRNHPLNIFQDNFIEQLKSWIQRQ